MKNFLLIIAVMLLSVTAAVSQVYKVQINWINTECNCLDQGDSYYAVKVVIFDDANNMVVVEGKSAKVDFGETCSVNIEVGEVNEHCANQNLLYPPNLHVMYGVSVICNNPNPIVALCMAYNDPHYTCSDFSNNNPLVLPYLNYFE